MEVFSLYPEIKKKIKESRIQRVLLFTFKYRNKEARSHHEKENRYINVTEPECLNLRRFVESDAQEMFQSEASSAEESTDL